MVWAVDLSGKTIIVTGGNRGIGLGISMQCAQAGANVAILYRSHKDAEAVAADLASKYNVKCKAYRCDVSQESEIQATVQAVSQEMGLVGGLVCNAGVAIHRPAIDMTKEDYEQQFGPNFWGVFACSQAVARLWKAQGYKNGRIVFVSSMSSRIANRGVTQVFYNPTKAALDALARNLAMEWAPEGILVNCINPGYVETDLNARLKYDKELSALVDNAVMLNRISQPEEQAGAVVFLLSEYATYITGQQLVIDGGATVW